MIVSMLTLCAGANVSAATDSIPRPVTSTYMIEGGSSHLADTYLTPIKYSGWHTALTYSRRQMMKFAPERWVMSLTGQASVDGADNPARNATMYSLDFMASWGMERRYNPVDNMYMGIGGATTLSAGILYLSRNSNNPVAAKAAWTIDLSAYASYRLRIGRIPLTVGISARIPAIGAFFTPDYGELYYEIYLGNHRGLVQCAWPGNYRRADLRLWADVHFGGTTLRLGYHGDLRSTKAHDIVSRHMTHAMSVGIVTQWLSIDTRRSDNNYHSAAY